MNQPCLTPSYYSFTQSILTQLRFSSRALVTRARAGMVRLATRRQSAFGGTHPIVRMALALSLGLVIQPPAAHAWTVKFSHPMTAINAAELQLIKTRINQRQEPQYKAFVRLMQDANNALSFKPTLPSRGTNFSMRGAGSDSAEAVYATALAWQLTGDDTYARKAVEILKAWANHNPDFSVPGQPTNHAPALDLGGWFSPMLYGADLLHHYPGWTPAERQKFERFWRHRVLHHTYAYLQGANPTSGGNNWTDSALRDVFAAAIVFEDTALAEFALTRLDLMFRSNRKFRLGVDKQGRSIIYFPAEVTRNNGKRGITYTAATLTRFVENVEMAAYLGYNWWNRKTPEGATIKGLIDTFFRWNYLNWQFPWNTNPDHEPSRRQNTFEYGNKHLALDPALGAWLRNHRPVTGGEGNIYATLLKAEIRGATAAPAAPTDLALDRQEQ